MFTAITALYHMHTEFCYVQLFMSVIFIIYYYYGYFVFMVYHISQSHDPFVLLLNYQLQLHSSWRQSELSHCVSLCQHYVATGKEIPTKTLPNFVSNVLN